MTLDISQLQTARYEQPQQWDQRDAITYALATGWAQDGVNDKNLAYIYEHALTTCPSFATSVARNGTPSLTALGGDYSKSVLASINATFHHPLPAAGNVNVSSTVSGVIDKGADRGAVVGISTQLHQDGIRYASVATSLMARADGGCGSFGEVATTPNRPDRHADKTHRLYTRPDQAALYRLLGDVNPLHIDPKAAANAGFATPILHGMCTFGIACRGLSELYDQALISVGARLSAPVLPGETLALQVWETAKGIHFELQSVAHQRAVLSAGWATFND